LSLDLYLEQIRGVLAAAVLTLVNALNAPNPTHALKKKKKKRTQTKNGPTI